jgi:hypothetical protein
MRIEGKDAWRLAIGPNTWTLQRLHRSYASMNWIRFNGSLRRKCQQYLSPLPGLPW